MLILKLTQCPGHRGRVWIPVADDVIEDLGDALRGIGVDATSNPIESPVPLLASQKSKTGANLSRSSQNGVPLSRELSPSLRRILRLRPRSGAVLIHVTTTPGCRITRAECYALLRSVTDPNLHFVQCLRPLLRLLRLLRIKTLTLSAPAPICRPLQALLLLSSCFPATAVPNDSTVQRSPMPV
jgi:hypothetical protein